MDKLKKYGVIAIVMLVFLVAIVAALNMTNQSAPSTGMLSDGQVELPVNGLAKGMPSSMMGNSYSERSLSTMSDSMAPEMDSVAATVPQKKEIKNGNLNLRVNNADSAAEKIAQIARDNGGEVFASNFYQTAKNIKSGNVEVRVPVANFEKTFGELKGVATLVIRESTAGRDVTMAYSDLQTQLKNKQSEEQAFLNILNQAGKIADVLDVTREVARVRGEIESLQGQIKFMDAQTDMASISIAVTEDTTVAFADKWRPAQLAMETINGLFKDMQGLVDFVIVLVIRVIPILFLYGFIIFGAYWVVRKLFFKNKA
ncbi:MAG: DUF4349 domain-containing protein [Parcubacteria group bacterium]|jgi:hypothetical protein